MKTADYRVTSPLIPPVREVKAPEFLAYPPLTGGQKWSEYELKGPALPR